MLGLALLRVDKPAPPVHLRPARVGVDIGASTSAADTRADRPRQARAPIVRHFDIIIIIRPRPVAVASINRAQVTIIGYYVDFVFSSLLLFFQSSHGRLQVTTSC